MSSPQQKKGKAGGSPASSQRKRGAENDLDVPTLGQVAEESRFEPLQKLLEPVEKTPVNKLGKELRAWLKEEGGKIGQLPLALSFIDDCDSRDEEAAPKRSHMAYEEGKQFFFSLVIVSLT